MANVAAAVYPVFPVQWLIKDRFDSASLATDIDIPVLITAAELDQIITRPHTLALKARFTRAHLSYVMIQGAQHNDIVDFAAYRTAVAAFLAGDKVSYEDS